MARWSLQESTKISCVKVNTYKLTPLQIAEVEELLVKINDDPEAVLFDLVGKLHEQRNQHTETLRLLEDAVTVLDNPPQHWNAIDYEVFFREIRAHLAAQSKAEERHENETD